MTPAVVSLAYRQEYGLPWHGEGVPMTGKVTALEAAKAAKMEYEMQLCPLVAQLPDGTTRPSKSADLYSNRTGNWEYINTIKKAANYGIVQNMDIVAILDASGNHPALSEIFDMDTAGVLDNGRNTFFCLKMGEDTVKLGIDGDDHYETYTLIHNNFTDGALSWAISSVRTVCMNTAIAALSESEANGTLWTFSHRSDPLAFLAYRAELEQVLQDERKKFYLKLEAMLRVGWNDEKRTTFIEKMYPLPPVPKKVRQVEAGKGYNLPAEIVMPVEAHATVAEAQYEANKKRAEENREGLAGRIEFYEQEHGASNLYWGFQGATDWINWRVPERGTMAEVGGSVMFDARRVENDRLMRLAGLVKSKRNNN